MRSQEREDSSTDWTSAYETLKPVFFRVLWRLAQQGYVSDAGQGMDLIHDFFAEAWPGLAKRYDASIASLKVYSAAAFARFARPRLVREVRWRQMLGHDEIDEIPVQASSYDLNLSIDWDRVRSAVAQLDSGDRRVLAARFGSDSISERQLARDAGTTRYRYREKVATALARFAAVLGDPGAMESEDFNIVRLIFGAGQSIDQVAVELSLSAREIRAARRRILRTLAIAAMEVSP